MTEQMPAGTRVRIIRGPAERIGHTGTVQREWPMQVALELNDGTWDVFSKGGLEKVVTRCSKCEAADATRTIVHLHWSTPTTTHRCDACAADLVEWLGADRIVSNTEIAL